MRHSSAIARQISSRALLGSCLLAVCASLGCEDAPTTTTNDIPVAASSDLSAVATNSAAGNAKDVPVQVGADQAQGKAQVEISFNTSPRVTAMTNSSAPLAAGSPVTLQVTACDDDGDLLGYHWTSTCPGIFDQPTLAKTVFVPGALTATVDCAFTVEVSDGRGGRGTGTLHLPVTKLVVEVAPTIGVVSQSTDAAGPSDVVVLYASASDPEGQNLTWTWTASDGTLSGQNDRPDGSDVRWTASATTGHSCTITATATNAQGASASYVFDVRM